MELTVEYCPTRRAIEERGWVLTTKFSTIAGRLVSSASIDHGLFNRTVAECGEIRSELAESHRQLRNHRSSHGC